MFSFFFFNDTATTEIYTLSLHDALPICALTTRRPLAGDERGRAAESQGRASIPSSPDRKSTRLNSSHLVISYAVFCLKKKKKNILNITKLSIPPHISIHTDHSLASP